MLPKGSRQRSLGELNSPGIRGEAGFGCRKDSSECAEEFAMLGYPTARLAVVNCRKGLLQVELGENLPEGGSCQFKLAEECLSA